MYRPKPDALLPVTFASRINRMTRGKEGGVMSFHESRPHPQSVGGAPCKSQKSQLQGRGKWLVNLVEKDPGTARQDS